MPISRLTTKHSDKHCGSIIAPKPKSSIERLSERGLDSVEESHGFRDAVEGQNTCSVIQDLSYSTVSDCICDLIQVCELWQEVVAYELSGLLCLSVVQSWSMEALPGDCQETWQEEAVEEEGNNPAAGPLPPPLCKEEQEEHCQSPVKQATNTNLPTNVHEGQKQTPCSKGGQKQTPQVMCLQPNTMQDVWHLPENTKIGKFATGALCSSQMKAGSH
ncbi:hypothetical protein L3Q82_006029 [Scortum barcoo]|uniref:Uncharacterized protein n=1 Tax=Scortum barcoo TaxID=214431 RepID=A0ACB8X2R3_9TELE|nr:hypothetical protein L3Q82_006029 [Scortum barcoo]